MKTKEKPTIDELLTSGLRRRIKPGEPYLKWYFAKQGNETVLTNIICFKGKEPSRPKDKNFIRWLKRGEWKKIEPATPIEEQLAKARQASDEFWRKRYADAGLPSPV